ncbi:MAG: RHS repeat protein [Nitrospirae bacterium]|nr:RHS repeat protein [Nitrospirota bacterium]
MQRRFLSLFICAFLIFVSIPPLSADTASYIYDDLGRLIKVVSGTGEVAIYNYDEVGNLVSISSEQTEASPPVLNSISPDVIFVGRTLVVTIAGENLSAAQTITSDNSGVSIKRFSVTDTSITATLKISPEASLGQTNLNIKTPYGSASISLTIAKLTFTPDSIAIAPNTTTEITASLEGFSGDHTVSLNNQNPDIMSVPQTITIPARSSTTFTITALAEGTGVMTAENTGVSVYVTQPFTGDTTVLTQSITIAVQQTNPVTEINPVLSPSLSVVVQQTNIGTEINPVLSPSVSVAVQSTTATTEINPVVSPSVSVGIGSGQQATDYGPVVSQPVSTRINSP